jgi:hypothetical protein
MILKVLRKLITAPLHIIQHSYKRAQEGFKFLTERPGYVQYGPDAKVADGRAYVSPVFELAGPSAPGTPEPKVKLYEEKKALKGYTTQYEYATEYEKPIEYDEFAAEVFNNLVENIQENIKENSKVFIKAWSGTNHLLDKFKAGIEVHFFPGFCWGFSTKTYICNPRFLKRVYSIVFYPAFDSKPGQVVVNCLSSVNYLTSGEIHRQVVVARILVVHGSVLVLKLVDLDCKEDVAHNGPQVYTPLGFAAAAGERHIEGLVMAPSKTSKHRRLEQGIDPLGLL